MAATDKSEVFSSTVNPDLEKYESVQDSYGLKLTSLNVGNLPQNRMDKTGYIERTFYGLSNGALFANNPSDLDPQRYCTNAYAFSDTICSK